MSALECHNNALGDITHSALPRALCSGKASRALCSGFASAQAKPLVHTLVHYVQALPRAFVPRALCSGKASRALCSGFASAQAKPLVHYVQALPRAFEPNAPRVCIMFTSSIIVALLWHSRSIIVAFSSIIVAEHYCGILEHYCGILVAFSCTHIK